MSKYSVFRTAEYNGITFSIENGGYGLSRGVAEVNGKELVTEWAYRDEAYSCRAILALIDKETSIQ
tara:strand:+ start:695 stop:892 length:198 start_codon:yes stop_codon:yes gene_type:complete